MATQKIKVEHVESALRQSAGIVTAAAQILEAAYGSCVPATVRNYIRRYPRLQTVIEETVELNLDLAESQLLGHIRDNNLTSIIFYLKTKGKGRGFVEKVEHGGSAPGGAIPILIQGDDAKL